MLRPLAALAADIKLAHSVFALPFAVVGAAHAVRWRGALPSIAEVALILVCMVLARTAAMTVNRAADARLDAANPRTAGRAVPAGRVPRALAWGVAGVCGAAFVAASAGFIGTTDNPWPLILSPAVLAVLCGYSLTKRFTWLCHAVLGVALALSPPAAALALDPASLASPLPWLLAGYVAGWVAGFDIFYAEADAAHDRKAGINSVPARFGVGTGRALAAALHALASAALVTAVVSDPALGAVSALGVVLATALLVYEHVRVRRHDHLEPVWFLINGVIALILGATLTLDLLRVA